MSAIIKSIIEWFLNHKLAANLCMAFLLLFGVFAGININKQVLPDLNPQNITIDSFYPGASSQVIERNICIPIENKLKDINNIYEVTSVIKKQLCHVTIELKNAALREETFANVKKSIDTLQGLPEQASKPSVNAPQLKNLVARVVISGNTSIENLVNISKNVKEELSDLGISQITQLNPINSTTLIETSRASLEKHKIPLPEIALSIEKNLGGTTGEDSTNPNNIKSITDIEDLTLRAYPNGVNLKLKDIAKIRQDSDLKNHTFFFDGSPAIGLIIEQGNNKDLSKVSRILHNYEKTKNKQLPNGINLRVDNDIAKIFDSRMSILGSNAIAGLILVLITLGLFLNIRLAFWVSLGIPIAFSGALIVLYLAGGSLDMISTFAFLLVLGVLVDDAIVVSESIYFQQQHYISGKEGVIAGIDNVSKSVFFAVITSMIMFVPLWFLPGNEGKLFASIPLIAISALLFSLFECFFILPAHLQFKTNQGSRNPKLIQAFQAMVEKFIYGAYRRSLNASLKWRYSVIAFFTVIFILCFSLLAGGWIKARFLSTIEADEAYVRIDLPDGTPQSTMQDYLNKIETATKSLKQELKDKYGTEQIQHTYKQMSAFGPNSAFIALTFPSRDDKKISSQKIADLWREKVGDLELASHLEFTATFNKPGPNIKLQLSSDDDESLVQATTELEQLLKQYPEVYGVENNIRRGAQEVGIELKDSALKYNIDAQEVALFVNQASQGIHISKNSSYDSDIIIRLPDDERNTIWHLEQLLIPTKNGQLFRLGQIADLRFHSGDTEIRRYNFKRSQEVSAYVDESLTSTEKIFSSVEDIFLNQLASKYPDVTWEKAGALKVKDSTKNAFLLGTILSLLAMYASLVILYKSIFKPLLVISAIPFGVVGAILGHWIFNLDFTIWSFAGIATVSGIVINDNVVLVDAIRDNIENHSKSIKEAVINASTGRFRAITLTSITTIVGVLPIIFERSWEAQFLVPMAISIAFGELFATFVGLFFVPALYMAYEDLRKVFN